MTAPEPRDSATHPTTPTPTRSAVLGAAEGQETAAGRQCQAVDYPVWSDGSQDTIPCEEPAGHVGPHVGDGGDWSWSS